MILQVTRYDQHPSEVIWTRVLRVQMHVGLGDVTSLIYLMFAITGLEILLFSARILINFLTIFANKSENCKEIKKKNVARVFRRMLR